MARLPRIHIEGALYYVTSRGDHNEDIFKDEEDYNMYLELLKKYKEQFGFKLFTFCLIPNHLHLLIELKEGLTISQIMHGLNSNYTKYFNGKNERKGHLFQERYKMVLLEKEPYLLIMSAYIHLNPRVLGLVKDLEDYPYSNYFSYLKTEELKNLKTETAPHSLGLKREGEVQEAVERLAVGGLQDYKSYLANIPKEEMEILGRELSKNIILGSEEFIKKIRLGIESYKLESPQPIVHNPQIHKKFVVAGSLAVLVLVIISILLYGTNRQLKDKFNVLSHQKDMEYSQKLSQEREFIKKDLGELHKADMVSFEAMTKRLEIEKNRVTELEGKIK